MNELVILREKEAVTTSLKISEIFQKEHHNVIKDINRIKDKIDNVKFYDIYKVGKYYDSQSRERDMYYMNRDGFTLLVMSYTGQKAMDFKVKYMEEFNRMEKSLILKVENSGLSSLDILKNVVSALEENNEKMNILENKVDMVKEVLTIEKDLTWRESVIKRMKFIGFKLGDYKLAAEGLYNKLEIEARCDLKNRMVRYKKRLEQAGTTQTDIKKANRIDVIEQDIKLRALFSKIVNIEYARINL